MVSACRQVLHPDLEACRSSGSRESRTDRNTKLPVAGETGEFVRLHFARHAQPVILNDAGRRRIDRVAGVVRLGIGEMLLTLHFADQGEVLGKSGSANAASRVTDRDGLLDVAVVVKRQIERVGDAGIGFKRLYGVGIGGNVTDRRSSS